MRHVLDEQDFSTITERLGDELPVHGELFSEEGPLDVKRCVSLEDVTGERDVITGVQGLLDTVNAQFWWYCNRRNRMAMLNWSTKCNDC